jgi:AmmeMemoRadiSam system protein B
METKRAAFAGTWYPGTAKECEIAIRQFLREGEGRLSGEFVGGIVPHAGWHFSGSIAARVIASLDTNTLDTIDTILLFGAHMHEKSKPFIMTHGFIETPFGEIEVDGDLVEKLAVDLPIEKLSPEKFPDENTLELQYPFIKYFFPRAKIVVCGVAPTNFASVLGGAAVEEAVKLGRNTRIIGSTDMTHYGPDFRFTSAGTGVRAVEWVKTKNDQNAIFAMEKMDTQEILLQGLDNKNMCCPGAAAAAIAACKKKGAVKAIVLDYATSFEKSKSDSFVGYSGLVYESA